MATLPQTTIAELPLAAHVVVALAFAIGMLLWVFGNRLLGGLFALLISVFGGLLGFFLIPVLLPASVFQIPSPYLGLGIGAIFGLALGLLLFRFAVAIGMGSVCTIASVLITGILLQSPQVENAAAKARGITFPDTPALREAAAMQALSGQQLEEATGPVEARVREFLDEKWGELTEAWNEIPQREQVRLVVAGAMGGLAGLLVGLLMPRRSAAACSALLGTAIWLPAFGWLAHAVETPGRQLLAQPALVWLVVWLVLALLGFSIQVVGLRRRKAED